MHAHSTDDEACAVAHGDLPPDVTPRTLVAVFESPVADYLLRFGQELGYRTVLVEPDTARVVADTRPYVRLASAIDPSFLGRDTDVVITDHDRPELGFVLRDTLAAPTRWVGVMGSVRHNAPHLVALRELGVDEESIARVHRPIGLNIGSRTPSEIAVATLAGLVADRNGRPGGFSF
ncbi:MAG TPA: XdhC family protein [Jiangellales bacterium]|nr:XdhC family protein [Jiangellales bacterium]